LSFFRKIFRLLRIAGVFAFGILEVLIKRPRTRPERAAWLSSLGRRLARAGHITWDTIGPVPMRGAVITNHLSYTDIIVHAALRPCVFVSKAELRKTPVLGWISMMAGTIYVVRGGGGSAAKAAEGMAKGFRDGLPVVYFPEGTTGVGDEAVMPMRSGLLAQTIEAEEPIIAGFIHYDLSPRDLAEGRTTRDDVHWGPQSLLAHMWNFASIHGLHATVHFAQTPIAFSPEAVAHRKVAAVEARSAVEALSVPIQQGKTA
jgi:1-acyl-sn-glycerol-3-phosphate acyltransferase